MTVQTAATGVNAGFAGLGSLIEALAKSSEPWKVKALVAELGSLSQSGLPNLSPLLKYILTLNGKPYTLADHFPFEPIFNTSLSKSITLKTGRQVSKCVGDTSSAFLYNPDFRPIAFADIKVGDKVLSVARDFKVQTGTVTGLFSQEPADLIKIVTSTGCECTVTTNHKLLSGCGYREAAKICLNDTLAVVRSGGLYVNYAIPAITAFSAFHDVDALTDTTKCSEPRFKEQAFVLNPAELRSFIRALLLCKATLFEGVLEVVHSSAMYITDLRALLLKLGIPSSVSKRMQQTVLRFDTKNSTQALETALPGVLAVFNPKPTVTELETSGDILWDPIVSITMLPAAESIDIEVETEHNYVLNGIVSHNSTSLASQGIIMAVTLPFFNTLYVTPLYEMIRRFSGNYVRGFIEQSPVKKFLLGKHGQSNVMQRSFYNESTMHFSFAFLDCNRVRGLNASKCCFDEIQNMDETFVPIIRETMSASPWGLSMQAGTPLTMNNILEKMWQDSSQAEWLITCNACGYENVPAMHYDIDDMIGPVHKGISEACPAIICAKCKRPIFPRTGRWIHKYPERRHRHAGYHVPQIIMPMHYASYDKWTDLCAKRDGAFNTTPAQFYNEVLGESYDTGSRLVTEQELRDACSLHPNELENARAVKDKYTLRVLGIDWGGGGAKETSFTTYAVMGLCADGTGLECIYGYRSLTPHDHKREAKLALQIARELECDVIAHDFNGAGAFREEYIITAGYPIDRIAPVSYVRASVQAAMRHIPASDVQPRGHYRLDKTRSLVSLCYEIKSRRVRFFEYDHKGEEQRGLVYDFMALVEEKTDTRTASDIYVILRQQNQSDDFAHAVNFAASMIWNMTDSWPQAASSDRYRVENFVIRDLGGESDDYY